MEPGILTPGQMLDLERLKIQMGRKDERTMRNFLKELGLKPVKYSKKEWVSTTLIIQAMERDMLSAQQEEK